MEENIKMGPSQYIFMPSISHKDEGKKNEKKERKVKARPHCKYVGIEALVARGRQALSESFDSRRKGTLQFLVARGPSVRARSPR